MPTILSKLMFQGDIHECSSQLELLSPGSSLLNINVLGNSNPECVYPNKGVMIRCYSKELDNHTRTQAEAQGNSCCFPSCWKHCFLLGALTASSFYQLGLKAALQRRANIHQNEGIAFEHDFSLSLQMTHHREQQSVIQQK